TRPGDVIRSWLDLRNSHLGRERAPLRNASQHRAPRWTHASSPRMQVVGEQSSCARHTAPIVIKESFSNTRCVFDFLRRHLTQLNRAMEKVSQYVAACTQPNMERRIKKISTR